MPAGLEIQFEILIVLLCQRLLGTYGARMSPDDLKEQLALIETALGGFLGLIVETIFGKLPPKPDAANG